MAAVRYESVLVEQALAKEYAGQMEAVLKGLDGLNDIKPLIRDFEKQFAKYIGVDHAIAVNSGSDALRMSLLAAGVEPGDEVIIPDLTYQAVGLAVVYCGATPVAVDAEKSDLQIDPSLIKKAITPKTKALIAAHMFGRPCDIEAIKRLCRDKNIVLIEDVCQAESSRYKGAMLGSFSDLAVFSFSYYKPLSSCGGGGGMVVFRGKKDERIRRWMEDWRDDEELLTIGQRFAPMALMDLIALRVKFTHLKKIIASRHQIKNFYEKNLQGVDGLTIFRDRPDKESVAQNFVVCCEARDRLFAYLAKNDVLAQKPYTPIHRKAAFKKFCKGSFPVSDWYADQALHLPLFSFMSMDRATKVVECCRSFLKERQS